MGRQFSRLLAAEVRASAVVMLDTPCSEVVWRVLATHSICQFPLHFPSRASPCAVKMQLDCTISCSSCRQERRQAEEKRHAIGSCLKTATCLSNLAVVYYNPIPLECLSRIKQIQSKQEIFSWYQTEWIQNTRQTRFPSQKYQIHTNIVGCATTNDATTNECYNEQFLSIK